MRNRVQPKRKLGGHVQENFFLVQSDKSGLTCEWTSWKQNEKKWNPKGKQVGRAQEIFFWSKVIKAA